MSKIVLKRGDLLQFVQYCKGMLIWKHMLFSVDCLAGTELQADGSCKKCERGYYRSQTEDNCLSCEGVQPGMTTNGLGAETSTDCNISRFCQSIVYPFFY
jgi:hypothetical protein